MVKCNTCGGTYEPLLPDGTQYFHVCPPVLKLRTRNASNQIGLVDPPLPAGHTLLEEVFVPPPQGRDENVPSTRADDHGKVKAAGKGITPQ